MRSLSASLYGPYTKYGHDTTKYLSSDIINIISAPAYPSLSGYYVFELHEYSFEVIVQPPNAQFYIPDPINQDITNMGFLTPLLNTTKGYDKELMWQDQYCQIWKVKTHVLKITHNISGQSVGPYLYPASARYPHLFKFEYFWIVF
jgi:hypothetical protein